MQLMDQNSFSEAAITLVIPRAIHSLWICDSIDKSLAAVWPLIKNPHFSKTRIRVKKMFCHITSQIPVWHKQVQPGSEVNWREATSISSQQLALYHYLYCENRSVFSAFNVVFFFVFLVNFYLSMHHSLYHSIKAVFKQLYQQHN